MNIEITDLDMILNYLETTSLEPHNDYTSEFTYKDQKTLYKYIKQLQQENEMLHHYKLLYQKVKDRNDKAIEYVSNYKTQQKEFIKYLEEEINKCQSNIFADGVKYGFQLSLSKYKEIIGYKNE